MKKLKIFEEFSSDNKLEQQLKTCIDNKTSCILQAIPGTGVLHKTQKFFKDNNIEYRTFRLSMCTISDLELLFKLNLDILANCDVIIFDEYSRTEDAVKEYVDNIVKNNNKIYIIISNEINNLSHKFNI